MHPYIYVLGHKIVLYNWISCVGILTANLYFFYALSRLNLNKTQIIAALLFGLVVQYFGGSLIPFLHRWIYFHKTPWWNIWQRSPGRYFHSVFLTSLFAWLVLCRIFRWPTKKVLDHFVIMALIASAIGRIGCFMQGCCRGKVTTLPWGLAYPYFPHVRLHPTQLYMLCAETFLVIYLLSFNKIKRYDGQTFWVGVLLYSVYRFCIEFVRINPIFIYGLTHAQAFSVLTFMLSLAVLLTHDQKLHSAHDTHS